MSTNLLGVIGVYLDITDQLPVIYSTCCQILEKIYKYNGAMHHLYIHFCTGYDSVRKKVSYIGMRHITTF